PLLLSIHESSPSENYTLSLHDALPISKTSNKWVQSVVFTITNIFQTIPSLAMLAIFIPIIGIGLKPAVVALLLYSLMPIIGIKIDRKSTRLNSSHVSISYAVFCLKKKK